MKKKLQLYFLQKIFNKKYGKIIDNHNHVIRLNDQKLKILKNLLVPKQR